MVVVAQLVRAPGCGPGGRRFESVLPPHFFCQDSGGRYRFAGFFFARKVQLSGSKKEIRRKRVLRTDWLAIQPIALLRLCVGCPAPAYRLRTGSLRAPPLRVAQACPAEASA